MMKLNVLVLSSLGVLVSLPATPIALGTSLNTNTLKPQLNTAPATADTLTILTWLYDSSQAIWHTSFGNYETNAQDGCRNPGVPGIYEVCYDWGQARGHFLADGQNKRCFREFKVQSTGVCADLFNPCSVRRWHEVGCDW